MTSKAPLRAELKALRVAAEIGGGVGLLLTVIRAFATGDVTGAVEPLLPVFGYAALIVLALLGIVVLVFAEGKERLGGLPFVLGPVIFLAAGMSVYRLGILVLVCCVVGLISMFVDLFRTT